MDIDKIPIGKAIIKGLDITSYSSTIMKFAVSPDKINDYDLLNEILPANFYMETAE